MPQPRKTLISLNATPYYYCVSRCVRRAFLCGNDTHSTPVITMNTVVNELKIKILELGQVFALDVCNYAIMHNHYHVLLHINADDAE